MKQIDTRKLIPEEGDYLDGQISVERIVPSEVILHCGCRNKIVVHTYMSEYLAPGTAINVVVRGNTYRASYTYNKNSSCASLKTWLFKLSPCLPKAYIIAVDTGLIRTTANGCFIF